MTHSIADCLLRQKELEGVSDTARLDVELLLQRVLKKTRSFLYAWSEKNLSAEEQVAFDKFMQRRASGEPVAYIVGVQGFWNLDLNVNESTLIPRPETELLVELALEYCSDDTRVLDLGTGTGAIALALASEFPSMHVEAVDLFDKAISLAEGNAEKNSIRNVRFYQSSWFEKVDGCFDLIVSNPPYIELDDPHLTQGDVRFEPKSALVSGEDGLDDIKKICKQAKHHLFEQGVLMVEHGWQQGESVAEVFAANAFQNITTAKDLGGRDRVTYGCLADV